MFTGCPSTRVLQGHESHLPSARQVFDRQAILLVWFDSNLPPNLWFSSLDFWFWMGFLDGFWLPFDAGNQLKFGMKPWRFNQLFGGCLGVLFHP